MSPSAQYADSTLDVVLSKSDDVGVFSVSIPRTLLIKVNAGHPFLAKTEARRALSLAIEGTSA